MAKKNDLLPIFVLNGPNLNLLGLREPEIYGRTTLTQIEAAVAEHALSLGLATIFRQSNHEGELVDWIQEARTAASGVILNAGAYTHTSVALYDALRSLDKPIVEVHLSNPHSRETFRHQSYISLVANGVIAGFGANSYVLAVSAMAVLLEKKKKG